MSQSKSEPFQITVTAIITLDDENKPQAVTVTNYGGMPSYAVRAVAQEALDSHFGLTSLRHGYLVDVDAAETFQDNGTESMVFETIDTVTSRV